MSPLRQQTNCLAPDVPKNRRVPESSSNVKLGSAVLAKRNWIFLFCRRNNGVALVQEQQTDRHNSVGSNSQNKKNYELPVPRTFGELQLPKASMAHCMAVLALVSTDTRRGQPRSKVNPEKKGSLALISVGVILEAHITTFFPKSQCQ